MYAETTELSWADLFLMNKIARTLFVFLLVYEVGLTIPKI